MCIVILCESILSVICDCFNQSLRARPPVDAHLFACRASPHGYCMACKQKGSKSLIITQRAETLHKKMRTKTKTKSTFRTVLIFFFIVEFHLHTNCIVLCCVQTRGRRIEWPKEKPKFGDQIYVSVRIREEQCMANMAQIIRQQLI